ncbi:MAG: oxygenase MpaB family protein [Alphaproteobacteria bacterium]
MQAIKNKLVATMEEMGGRHDEAAIYGGEKGDLGLCGGPDSISWEINGDLASVTGAGTAAVLMEVLHPSVMAGVFTQSNYRVDPLGRARNTLGYVLRSTFGNTKAAERVIGQVKTVHGYINGTRTDGVPYKALDPELIGWVHTCIPWAIMMAYERFNKPLTIAQKDQYLKEQALIGRMGGADWVPETVAELEDYVEKMRGYMAYNDQTRQFVDFLLGVSGDFETTRKQRFDGWTGLHGSMALMPDWARKMTHSYHSPMADKLFFKPNETLKAKIVRWAAGELPCKTIATARVLGTTPAIAPSEEATPITAVAQGA